MLSPDSGMYLPEAAIYWSIRFKGKKRDNILDTEEWNQFMIHPNMTTLEIFHTNFVQRKSRGGRKYRREKEHILGYYLLLLFNNSGRFDFAALEELKSFTTLEMNISRVPAIE